MVAVRGCSADAAGTTDEESAITAVAINAAVPRRRTRLPNRSRMAIGVCAGFIRPPRSHLQALCSLRSSSDTGPNRNCRRKAQVRDSQREILLSSDTRAILGLNTVAAYQVTPRLCESYSIPPIRRI